MRAMIKYDDILEQNPWWHGPGRLPAEAGWPRRNIFETILADVPKDLALMITGLRRTGKSTIARQLIGKLLEDGLEPERLVYFAFDKYSLFKSPDALEFLIKSFLKRKLRKQIHDIDHKVYLFIDEIQYIDFWQDIVKRYYDLNKNLKFILTGSQSAKLKGKSRESLAGRIMDYHLPVLDYGEYLTISKQGGSVRSAWDFDFQGDEYDDLYHFHYRHGAELESGMPGYLCYGQFPETAPLEHDVKFRYDYIRESVLGKILERDIPSQHNITKIQPFKHMAWHLITNSGSMFELNNLARETGVSKATSENYFSYLKDGFVVDVLYKYLRSNIKKGRALKKAYATSTNFITAINSYRPDYYDKVPEVFGKIIETYAWQRLSLRFENLSLWRSGDKEVDFIIPALPPGKEMLLLEVKFSPVIRSKDVKYILNFAGKKKCSKIVIVTKNRLNKKISSGVEMYFIPYYMI